MRGCISARSRPSATSRYRTCARAAAWVWRSRLQLSAAQRQQLQAQYEAMKEEAIRVGEKLITREAALDRHFAEHNISPDKLASLTAQIGETQGELRAVHLKYHLTTAEVLTDDQRRQYAELRGYR
jgi:hypothetical protein